MLKLSDKFQKRYNEYCSQDQYLSILQNQCHIEDFIRNIKVTISRQYGIPYGLHNSLGDYIFNHTEKRMMNYAEFCNDLHDPKTRLKYQPLIQFWTGIVTPDKMVHKKRVKKISLLIFILEQLKNATIREDEGR